MNLLGIPHRDGQQALDFTGKALAQAGMAQTLEAESEQWLNEALFALKHFALARGRFKTEDFRAWYRIPAHDHHVWGALTNRACKSGLIRWTGRYIPSTSPKTHGHPVKEWEPC